MRIKNAFVFALNKHHKAALGISAKHRFIEYSHPHAIRLICIVQSVCILRHGGVFLNISIAFVYDFGCKGSAFFRYLQEKRVKAMENIKI